MVTICKERVWVGPLGLAGELVTPPEAAAVVVLVAGANRAGDDARNGAMAQVLHRHAIATLCLGLLRAGEAVDGRHGLDLDLLAARLEQVVQWVSTCDALAGLPVGLLGTGAGAAVALQASTQRSGSVSAVVSRSGRPDLAERFLQRVNAPTLLIVGGADARALAVNRHALRMLGCSKRLEVVPAAGHRFEEPGALNGAAELTADWFSSHLVRRHLA
ncbi:MAG: alpha/beta hydrolase family protein [Burkholderiaceae bacterium]